MKACPVTFPRSSSMLSGPLQNRLHAAFALGTIGLLAGCPEKRAPAEGAPVVLSASAAVGSAPPTPSLRSVSEVCATICEPSHVLKCNNAEQCLAHCVAAGTGTPFRAPVSEWFITGTER